MIHVSTTPFYRLTALLCLGRVIAARFPAVGAECQRKCGGVEIPYPFGVGAPGSGCAMSGFELICSDTGNGEQKPFHKGSELLSISLLQAQVRMSMGITSSCYDDISKKMDNNIRNLDLAQTPYRFSGTGNKFTVIGCQTLAYISSNYDVSNGNLMTGCLATCREADLASLTDGTCSGIGCCQTAIPKGLQNYTVWFGPRFNTSDIYKMSRCSYAALVEASSFTFSSSYANSSAFIDTHGGKAPLLVDWAIGNETCEEARKKPESYACVSSNSECIDSRNGPGYICNCTKGFQGNPYLKGPDGCGDTGSSEVVESFVEPPEPEQEVIYYYQGEDGYLYEMPVSADLGDANE